MSAIAAKLAGFMGPFRIRITTLAVFVLLALGMAATAAMTPHNRISDSRNHDFEKLVPKSFAGWTIDETEQLVLPDPGQERLVNEIYNSVLARAYRNGAGQEVMLLIAYGGDQSDALQLHRPEVCYASNGYQVGDKTLETVKLDGYSIPITRLSTHDHYGGEPLSYWMRVGSRIVSSTADRQIAKVKYGLRGVIPDGVLVRVSNRTKTDNDMAANFALQDRFLSDLLRNVDEPTRRLLIGDEAKPSLPKLSQN